MNKWQKILADLQGKKALQPRQRFWKSLALLRLGNTQESHTTIREGGAAFLSSPQHQILYAEVLLTTGHTAECEKILDDCFTEASRDSNLFSSWAFCYGRIPKPSTRLSALYERNSPESQKPHTQNLNSEQDWKRMLAIEKHKKSFELYIQWLSWEETQNNPRQKLTEITQLCLAHCELSSYHYYQIFQILKKHSLWDYLIDTLFLRATRTNRRPELLWKNWINTCPSSHQHLLTSSMAAYLSRNPSLTLESILRNIPKTS